MIVHEGLPEIKIALSDVTISGLQEKRIREALALRGISGTAPHVSAFERNLCLAVGRDYAIGCVNGTAALHLALLALDVGPGDEVIVPGFTFMSPAAMVVVTGARPVFADIDEDSWTIDPSSVQEKITSRTKAIIAVNVCGYPCDFDALAAFGIPIIEDAAESHGALYRGKQSGSLGLISIFSFHANKAITSGEGGAVLTDDHALAQKMRLYANHGMTGKRAYVHEVIGYNYRMNGLTAALALGQIDEWDHLIESRQEVGEMYLQLVRHFGLPVGVQVRRPGDLLPEDLVVACWVFTVLIENRDEVAGYMRAHGIDTRSIWPSALDQPAYHQYVDSDLPISKWVADRGLLLPTWTYMPQDVQVEVIQTLAEALGAVGVS